MIVGRFTDGVSISISISSCHSRTNSRLVTEGSSVNGISQSQCVNECKRADQR